MSVDEAQVQAALQVIDEALRADESVVNEDAFRAAAGVVAVAYSELSAAIRDVTGRLAEVVDYDELDASSDV